MIIKLLLNFQLLQKHLNELEKYQQNQNSNEICQIQEIDETGRIESGNDSGCENYSDRKSDNDSSNHSRTRSISPISDEDTGAPQTKRSKMIDVVTVDQVSPITNAQRNVFSIRNLIYSKDTSDSDTDNHSEDSGNAPSASNGSSPPRPWSPDQEILRKLKEDLSSTLHQFVDTVVQDVVAKVASNYRETLSKHKASSVIQPKEEPKAIMSSEEKAHCLSSTASTLSPASSAVANISASVGQQLSQQQQQQAAAAASQRAQQIHQLRQTPNVNPTGHHSVLHQQAALAVRQSPLFLPR